MLIIERGKVTPSEGVMLPDNTSRGTSRGCKTSMKCQEHWREIKLMLLNQMMERSGEDT